MLQSNLVAGNFKLITEMMYDVNAAGWCIEVREQLRVIVKREVLQVSFESAGS